VEEVDHEITVEIEELDVVSREFMPVLTEKAMEDTELLFVNDVVILVRVADIRTKELEDDEVISVSPM
jgi:hypothetical protein